MSLLNIEICVCTECVMNGAMDIMDSIEHLTSMSDYLEDQYDTDIEIVIHPVKSLGESKHGALSPKVAINGIIFENATSSTIMAEIMNKMKKV